MVRRRSEQQRSVDDNKRKSEEEKNSLVSQESIWPRQVPKPFVQKPK
jgi:hypothetical protein